MNMLLAQTPKETFIDDPTLFLIWRMANPFLPEFIFLKFGNSMTEPIRLSKYLDALKWAGITTYEPGEILLARIDETQKKTISVKIKNYLNSFQEGRLFSSGINIFNFKKHQELIDKEMKEMYEKYGSIFEIDLYEMTQQREDYLPIHYVLWLLSKNMIEIEWLDYKLKRISSEDFFLDYTESVRPATRVKLKDIYLEVLISNAVSKPRVYYQNSFLNIGNYKIEITASNQRTLMNILSSDWYAEWDMEKLSVKWGDEYEDRNKCKYVNAAYRLKDLIYKKTKIDDFIIPGTKLIKVNLKYLE